jgi:hypothetical protein
MNGRNMTRRVAEGVAAVALAAGSFLFPVELRAGIVRDVMYSLHLSPKPPPAAAGQGLPRQGFACCNLHYSKDWIDDGNYAELPMISAGTPIEVDSYGKDRAYVKIDGKPMRLGHEYGRDQESLEVWVNKIVVSADPRPRMAGWPKPVRDAVYEGKIMTGMTREQVIAAVGYPLTNENVSLDQPTWRMWRSSRGEYQVNFRADGHVRSVTGDDSVTSQILYRPEK